MTDEDLIHHLRHSKGWPTLGNAAADRIEALRAALDEAEAEARDAHLQSLASMGQATEAHDAQLKAEAELHHWRQAAAKGSIYTQADLDRAVDKARAEAYLSGWVNGSNGIEPPDFGNPVFEKDPGDEADAEIDTPAAEALERVRAEERERLCGLMDGLATEFSFVDMPLTDSVNQSCGMPRVGDQFASRMRTFTAAIRARGET